MQPSSQMYHQLYGSWPMTNINPFTMQPEQYQTMIATDPAIQQQMQPPSDHASSVPCPTTTSQHNSEHSNDNTLLHLLHHHRHHNTPLHLPSLSTHPHHHTKTLHSLHRLHRQYHRSTHQEHPLSIHLPIPQADPSNGLVAGKEHSRPRSINLASIYTHASRARRICFKTPKHGPLHGTHCHAKHCRICHGEHDAERLPWQRHIHRRHCSVTPPTSWQPCSIQEGPGHTTHWQHHRSSPNITATTAKGTTTPPDSPATSPNCKTAREVENTWNPIHTGATSSAHIHIFPTIGTLTFPVSAPTTTTHHHLAFDCPRITIAYTPSNVSTIRTSTIGSISPISSQQTHATTDRPVARSRKRQQNLPPSPRSHATKPLQHRHPARRPPHQPNQKNQQAQQQIHHPHTQQSTSIQSSRQSCIPPPNSPRTTFPRPTRMPKSRSGSISRTVQN